MRQKTSRAKEIADVAREHLGLETLRAGQEEAVTALLQGHDTLVVQPTGSGKSAIYQIAGLMIEGVTVVISPLIALQKDQVDAIERQIAAGAAAINSTVAASEMKEGLEKAKAGDIEFVFLAPEQLRKPETLAKLSTAGVSLFVVDEAHCISDWGHDFRPDYMRLGAVVDALGHPRVLALTATATQRVRDEIVDRLHLRKPKTFVQGFDRPNIHLRVDSFKTPTEKRDALAHRVRWAEKPGIIYTGTRKAAEEIMRALEAEGIDALYYHGGLKAKDRHEIQERFMASSDAVMVATNAFGMGIDKPDIRFVYHNDPSDSLDSYYQEIGRAGRDGQKADAVLFFRRQDIGAQSFKASEGKLDEQTLQRVMECVAAEEGSADTSAIAKKVGISERKVISALQRLKDAGAVETVATSEIRVAEVVDSDEAVQAAAEQHEILRETKKQRLQKMREYAELSTCRRQMLLAYFGESLHEACGNCDNCEAAAGPAPIDPQAGTRREVV